MLQYLSCEELSCWQIWKQAANDLTLQRKSLWFLQGDSLQVSEDENHIMNHKGDHFSCLENQEFLILTAQTSCGSRCLSESENPSRDKQMNVKNHLHVCEGFTKNSPLSKPGKTDAKQTNSFKEL